MSQSGSRSTGRLRRNEITFVHINASKHLSRSRRFEKAGKVSGNTPRQTPSHLISNARLHMAKTRSVSEEDARNASLFVNSSFGEPERGVGYSRILPLRRRKVWHAGRDAPQPKCRGRFSPSVSPAKLEWRGCQHDRISAGSHHFSGPWPRRGVATGRKAAPLAHR